MLKAVWKMDNLQENDMIVLYFRKNLVATGGLGDKKAKGRGRR